jgi:hypothetical protein
MAEGMSATLANACLANEVDSYTWIKLHTGAPGSAGTSNAAGETTRQQATWGAPSGGAIANTAAVTWTSVSTSEDFTHWSAWSAETDGTFGFSGTLTANAVTAGDNFEIAIGDLDVTLTVAS